MEIHLCTQAREIGVIFNQSRLYIWLQKQMVVRLQKIFIFPLLKGLEIPGVGWGGGGVGGALKDQNLNEV